MKMIFVIIFIIFNCGLSFGKISAELDTVIFANVVSIFWVYLFVYLHCYYSFCIIIFQLFRHGDRTPIDPYPNDPYNNETLWPVPFGQLTNVR